MAHFKVVVGALLACAICVQGFPADSPASSGFGVGSSSFEQNKPLSSFGGAGSTFAPRPLPGSFYPQQVSTGSPFGSTVNRFVRDDSHEQAHGHTANSDSSSSTSAPHRRDATTETIKSKPLIGAFATATTEHTAARRDVLGGATVKPVPLPGSLAASSVAATTTAPKSKRDQNSQANGSTSRRPYVAATVPASFNKPTAAPLNKRDQGSQISGSTSRPATATFGSFSQTGKPLSASDIASKIKRNAEEARAAGTTSKPAAVSTSAGSKPAVKPLVSSTTASSKNKRESTSTSSPVKPVRPQWTTDKPSGFTSNYQLSTSSNIRNKRQAPLSASDEAPNDDDNRQLFNRPTFRPSSNDRPTRRPLPGLGLFNRRSTTPSSISSQSNAASFSATSQSRPIAATSQFTTVSAAKFKRDQFPTPSTDIYKPLNVEHFSGTETLPGQTTYFTGSSLSSNNPAAGTSGFSGTSVSGTTFSNNPHLIKRETNDGDSSSGESQED